jgi:hypothetical protein
MKKLNLQTLIIGLILFLATSVNAQIGYYDAPYTHYEADSGTLANGAAATTRSYKQTDVQSEASNQVCVNLSTTNASVSWTVLADGDGLVVRYSIPDTQTGSLDVYADNVFIQTITLTSYYSWEYLSTNGDPNNVGIVNANPRMRFDEVRLQLPSKILAGGNLKLVRNTGTIQLDFAELEPVAASVTSSTGDVIYTGNGSDLQTIIDANGGKTIYIPAGVYNISGQLYFGVDNTILKGAGMWYTELHFTGASQGGLVGNANNISYSDLYLTTVKNSRAGSYKGINGVYTSGSTITNIWTEHFVCGAWIAQYNTGSIAAASGFTISNCRFRNNYADGINLCKGTSSAIVEHCSFRNNGDDDMAIWSANNMACQNNIFRYNTAENGWRSSGCAIYGGLSNLAQHLLIKDHLETGIRVNNSFAGAPFDNSGMHEFSDISIISCGTFNDLYNNPVGAIDIACANGSGTYVTNVKFSNITITNSRNDAIYMYKTSGVGFNNLVFENIAVNGTGAEYPYNNAKGLNWGRGYGILFVNKPAGYGTYCNMTYANLGGNSGGVTINNALIGTFSWTSAGCGTYVTSPANGAVFGECGPTITITGDASVANGAIVKIEFFIDGTKVGEDATAPYTYDWTTFTLGIHKVYVKSTHAPSNNTISSPVSTIIVDYFKGLFYTSTPPIIDGSADALWTNYAPASIDKISIGTVSGAADLSATFQISYDSTNLYLFVDVTDNILVNNGGLNYNNDELELFLDIGNTKTGTYGANDFSYNFVYNNPTVYENQHNAITGVTFAQAVKTGGYRTEISIPWATLGTVIIPRDSLLGFDLHVDDDDNGTTRHAKKAWNDCADIAWKDPAVFGILQDSGCATSVPTGFVDFTGVVGLKPVLNWDTYYDFNDSNFEVLRDATGSGTFTSIATVAASGSQGVLSPKSYTDNTAPNGLVSYRISKVDVNGCIIMSEIIQLSITTGIMDNILDGECNFYPNPFTVSGNLSLSAENGEVFSVSILDLTGKSVWNEKLTGKNIYTIGDQLPSGMYVLEIVNGNAKKTIKLIKL